MQISVILENKSDRFYRSLDFFKLPDEKYIFLKNTNLNPGLKFTIGSGSISDSVDFNIKRKSGEQFKSFELLERRGYKIAKFEI